MQETPQREDSHKIIISNFDGTHEVVEADEIHFCLPTGQCVKFWATIIACFISIAIGIFFMIYQGTSSPYFFIGEGLLAMAIGVLIPAPNYEAMVVRRGDTLSLPLIASRPIPGEVQLEINASPK